LTLHACAEFQRRDRKTDSKRSFVCVRRTRLRTEARTPFDSGPRSPAQQRRMSVEAAAGSAGGGTTTTNVKLLRPDAQGIMAAVFKRFAGPVESGTLSFTGFASMLADCGVEAGAAAVILSSGVFEVGAQTGPPTVDNADLAPCEVRCRCTLILAFGRSTPIFPSFVLCSACAAWRPPCKGLAWTLLLLLPPAPSSPPSHFACSPRFYLTPPCKRARLRRRRGP